jgi:L-ascorbate metabolism protein UlaG (beta-lactamase superfamily)
VALVPVNGARQPGGHFSDVGQPMVMGPEQAAAAASALRAKTAIPIHYGMNDPPDYIEVENAERRFLDAAKALNLATRVMKVRETLAL